MPDSLRKDSDKTSLIASRVKLCGTVIFSGTIFIGFLAFVSFVLPSLEDNGYIYTTCNVTRFLVLTDSFNKLNCKCPLSNDKNIVKCVIYYPCLKIFASFVDSHGKLREGLLVKCRRHVGERCSKNIPNYECMTEKTVYQKLEELKENYGKPGTSFSCYYKENQPGYVVLKRSHLMKSHVLNVVLWTCLGVVVGIILMVYSRVLSTYYCGYKQQRADDIERRPLASNMDT